MSVDKFGHYLNDKSEINLAKNAPKLLGFFVDQNNNIDVQNKRIKNVANALEENDCINKLFLQTQIDKQKQEIKFQLENHLHDFNKQMDEKITNIKTVVEHQNEELREKVYRLENYIYVSIADSASIRTQLTEKKEP